MDTRRSVLTTQNTYISLQRARQTLSIAWLSVTRDDQETFSCHGLEHATFQAETSLLYLSPPCQCKIRERSHAQTRL